MKRILVMGMSKDRGGMETFIMNYYRHIDRNKFQFDFISYNEAPYCAEEIKKLGGRCFVITGRFTNYRKNKKELKELFAAHGHEYAALWYNCCLVSDLTILKLAAKYNIPRRIVHAHNSQAMGSKLANLLHTLYKSKLVKYATDFWACSAEAGNFFYSKQLMESDKFRIIINAIDTKNYVFHAETRNCLREELGIADAFVLGNVARLDPEKNHSFLLDIFSAVRKRNSKAVLLVIGQGRLEAELKAKVKLLKLDPYVKFLGERTDMPALYCAMDVFVLPSQFEGLPMTLIEAQTSGLPSFTSTEAVPQEAAATPLLSFISLREEPEQWAESICAVSSDEHFTDRSQAEKAMTRSRWNITRAASLLEELF